MVRLWPVPSAGTGYWLLVTGYWLLVTDHFALTPAIERESGDRRLPAPAAQLHPRRETGRRLRRGQGGDGDASPQGGRERAARHHAARELAGSYRRPLARDGALFVGSPETVAAKIAKTARGLGLARFDLKYSNGTMPHELLMNSIGLYGREVAPRVRELLAD